MWGPNLRSFEVRLYYFWLKLLTFYLWQKRVYIRDNACRGNDAQRDGLDTHR